MQQTVVSMKLRCTSSLLIWTSPINLGQVFFQMPKLAWTLQLELPRDCCVLLRWQQKISLASLRDPKRGKTKMAAHSKWPPLVTQASTPHIEAT
jgi:hypothetical protein